MIDAVVLLARLLMSVVFIRGGIGKLLAPSTTMATFHHLHLPLVGAVYALAVAVELGGGAATLLGWRARAAAVVLAAWCVATAAVAHWHPGSSAQMIAVHQEPVHGRRLPAALGAGGGPLQHRPAIIPAPHRRAGGEPCCQACS